MDKLLNYLENKKKYENSESASSPDGDAELKHWVDKVADKYDSEDSTAP